MSKQSTALLLSRNLCFLSGSKTPLQSFLGIAEQHTAYNGVRFSLFLSLAASYNGVLSLCSFDCSFLRQSNVSQCASPHNPTAITAEEYFNPEFNLNGRDIGRPIELTSKVQKYDVAIKCLALNSVSLV